MAKVKGKIKFGLTGTMHLGNVPLGHFFRNADGRIGQMAGYRDEKICWVLIYHHLEDAETPYASAGEASRYTPVTPLHADVELTEASGGE